MKQGNPQIVAGNANEDHQAESHTSANQDIALTPRPPLERNLNLSDFPPPSHHISTTEQVMEQLLEATYQYTNHPDLIEREARRQRVLESNSQGIMEETAARIIESERTAVIASSPAQQLVCFRPEPGHNQNGGIDISFENAVEEDLQDPAPTRQGTTRTARPPRPRRHGSTSRGLRGSNLRKHNLALTQRSPLVRSSSTSNLSRTPQRTPRRRSSGRTDNTTGTHEERLTSQENTNQRTPHHSQSGTRHPVDATPQVDFHHLDWALP